MLGAIDYRWWVFVHLIGVFVFLISHGVSITVGLRLRTERDRERIRQLLQLSGETILWLYGSLATVRAGGIVATTQIHAWSFKWIRLSLGLLLGVTFVMGAVARPYYRGIKEAVAMRPSGLPRVSDDDLAARLRSWQPIAIAALGFGALVAILWMMIFKRPL